MTWITKGCAVRCSDFFGKKRFKTDHSIEAEIARIRNVLDDPGVERIVRLVVLDYDCRFVKGQTHAKFKHDIRVFTTYVADHNISAINILNDSLLYNPHIIRVADELHLEFWVGNAF